MNDLEAALESAVREYWRAGGPGPGTRAYWRRVEELRAQYGDEAVEAARDRRDTTYYGACEDAEARREEAR